MELPKPKPSDDTREALAAEKRNVYNENKNRVIDHLRSKGLRDEAVAAILANIDVETGGSFDFTQKQTKSGDPSDPRTIEYGGYGLFQFDDYSPNQGHRSWYQEYLKDTGKEDSTESQIDYVIGMIYAKDPDSIEYKYKERMGKGDAEVLQQYLDTTDNPSQISDAFVDRFEKAGIPHSDKRRNKTDKYYREITRQQNINQDEPISDTGADVPMSEEKGSFPEERVIDVPEDKSTYQKVKPYIPILRHFNEGGAVPMKRQMEMFEDGGLMDEGGTVDPVSGNDVPPGSTQEEVRDDIPAQLSEGEFVFPADVVRFIGLNNLMQMRQQAKMGLKMMEEMGQMGNSEQATIPDDLPFTIDDLDIEEEMSDNTQEFAVGGMPSPNPQSGVYYSPSSTGMAAEPMQAASVQYQQPMFAQTTRPQQAAVPTVPTYQRKELPEYIPFIGGGAPNVEQETRQFINDEGNIIDVIYNKATGEPLNEAEKAKITEGYKPYDPTAPKVEETTVTPTQVGTTSVIQDSSKDERQEQRQREEEEEFGPGGGRLGIDKTIYGVSFEGINPLTQGRSLLGSLLSGGMIPANLVDGISVNLQNKDGKFNVTGQEYNAIKQSIKEHGANSEITSSLMDKLRLDAKTREAQRAAAAAKREEERVNAAAIIRGDDKDSSIKGESYDVSKKGAALEASLKSSPTPGGKGEGRQDYSGGGNRPDSKSEEKSSSSGPPSGSGKSSSGSSSGSSGTQSGSTGGGYGGGFGDRDRFRAKGGLMEAPKPKAKKKMKRGGLASKK